LGVGVVFERLALPVPELPDEAGEPELDDCADNGRPFRDVIKLITRIAIAGRFIFPRWSSSAE
jgi:hypothetical protein